MINLITTPWIAELLQLFPERIRLPVFYVFSIFHKDQNRDWIDDLNKYRPTSPQITAESIWCFDQLLKIIPNKFSSVWIMFAQYITALVNFRAFKDYFQRNTTEIIWISLQLQFLWWVTYKMTKSFDKCASWNDTKWPFEIASFVQITDSLLTIIEDKDKQQIVTFRKLEAENVWQFCSCDQMIVRQSCRFWDDD